MPQDKETQDFLTQIRVFAERPIIECILRWSLGLLFIVAALPKIFDPMALARIIDGYGLVPEFMIDPAAYVLPYVELAAGLSLVLGAFPRYGLYIINALLTLFIIVITINILRGHEFSCGCFSMDEEGDPTSPLWLLARDCICLVIGIHLIRVPDRICCLGTSRM